ncbi:hypothetical protein Q8A64_15030 [Oxalobacteraceae bacterium R-40]|uniref:Uncharacterized protein n=1 Tax=Keguizhuia sedimenti TaxID=3064264 RepID=A0ABU1BUQ0_9BURK|nr:hypothetical protein [Oxalobacteraceae bacterium R-40]
MIYDALIVPTETPSTLREIKRALLTYDQILLIDPSDRELFPRQAFIAATRGMPFAMDLGPVRPMGKGIGYDERFERTLEYCKTAVSQNTLKVISTFTAPKANGITIGGAPLGGYPLNPADIYQFYRSLASSQDLLTDVIGHDAYALKRELQNTDGLAMTGLADNSDVGGTSLPIAEVVENEQLAEPLTQIARARIGAILKYSGYCEAKSLVPIFGAPSYTRALGRILNRARTFLDAGTTEDQFRRSRVLDLAHEEFLVDERLDALSVDDVLRLRSTAWGQQAVAREHLFEAIFKIADSSREDDAFLEAAAKEIQDYRKASESLVRERESLGMSIKCDLGIGALKGGIATVGLMSLIESPLQSIAMTLAAGGVLSLEKAKEYVPKWREIQAQTADLKRGAGFAFYDFYSRLPK